MVSTLSALMLLPCLSLGQVPAPEGSYLGQPIYKLDRQLRGPATPYMPQPGDIMLATDDNIFWEFTHFIAGAGNPHNSAIVFARRDGSLAILESGPDDTLWVKTLDALPHLTAYASKGPVWLRSRRVPLTAEQSARLTEWAETVDGKRFALVRLGGQLTLLRSRGPIRTFFVGGPHGVRDNYFCSELVTESCVAAGLIDPAIARPAATYPHDLFYNWSLNLFLNQNFHLEELGWAPPARWTPTSY